MKTIAAALLLAFSPAIAQEIPIQCNATLIVQAANRAAELERLCGWSK